MTTVQLWRRLVVVVFVVVSLAAAVAGQLGTSRVFAWQMFPESSTRHAVIERVTTDGRRIDISLEWPGGYRWDELASGSGVGDVVDGGPASYGVAVTTERMQRALDWVATHTPHDHETVRIEAALWTSHNGRPETLTTLVSIDRAVTGAP